MAIAFDLCGRKAVVTGANSGIGQAIAIAFAEAGADVALIGRSSADETLERIALAGATAIEIRADLVGAAQAARAIGDAGAGLGQVDILVNNAGIIRRNDLLQFSEEDWDAVLDTNLKSAFFLSQAAARGMAERGRGKIINIASLLSFQGGIRVPSYAAAKSGLAGLTKAMANELAPSNVQVNAIAPGYIATANTAPLREDAERSRQILERIPAGRWGRPEDIAGAAIFLASGASDYVTGHVLAVDGGWLAR